MSTCSHRTLESPLGLGGAGQQTLTTALGASLHQLPQGQSVGLQQLMLLFIPGPSHLVCPVLERLPPASHQNVSCSARASCHIHRRILRAQTTGRAQQILVGFCLAQFLPWPGCWGHSGDKDIHQTDKAQRTRDRGQAG